MKALEHLKTVIHHRRLVRQGCFRVGLYGQGLFHDLSKFSPTEFLVGCKYYQGNMSPNNAERLDKGLSYSWLHHKGRNKHHIEYWIDFSLEPGETMIGMKVPKRYVVEMLMDRIAAAKIYQKEKYTDRSPWEYYKKSREHLIIHPETQKLLERLLLMLAKKGEDKTFAYIRRVVLKQTH